ncbi:TPA: triose-phosphate isomerase [Candidatus Woesearchaeota archaeon]|nr:triose-phosphate isomerase [Candidatus Woesearchaeota archaeon]HII68902.1 triose-phosphate isomerase [Candidatus Woesearchaeota archaeon]
MRTPIIAGNWKMNQLSGQAWELAKGITEKVGSMGDKEVVLCPPFTSLATVYSIIKDTPLKLGAQNAYCEKKGAFTGEVSPGMLRDAGCSYVILGHSERRLIFDEDDELINQKVKISLATGLRVILCVGETLEQRDQGNEEAVVASQLEGSLADISDEDMTAVVIAYEPVWAIGTGETATPAEANKMHAFIRKSLSIVFSEKVAEETRILYGGSVNPDNVKELMEQEEIDGVLVGGASLSADSFVQLVRYELQAA